MRLLYVDNGSIIKMKNRKKVGGGIFSNYYLLEFLRKKYNFDIKILTFGSNIPNDSFSYKLIDKKIKYRGVLKEIYFRRIIKKSLLEELKNNQYDFVFSPSGLSDPALKIANKLDVYSCTIIRAYMNLYLKRTNISLISKINNFIERKLFRNKELNFIKNSDLIMTNSNFIKEFYKNKFKIDSEVIYPPFKFDFSKYNFKKKYNIKYLGVINPIPKKGLNVIKKISKKLNNMKIYYYGKKPNNYKNIENEYKNIHFQGWTDQKLIYKDIDILLVPSIWEEPFGRVSVEAIKYGVLPIVSSLGGLPETINNKKNLVVENPNNINEWVFKINNINVLNYEKILNSELNHIKKFSLNEQGEKFYDSLMNVYNN